LDNQDARHKQELAQVRHEEREEFRLSLAALGKELRAEREPEPQQQPRKLTPAKERAQHRMLAEVRAGRVAVQSSRGADGNLGGGMRFLFDGQQAGAADEKSLRVAADAGFIGWSFSDPSMRENPQGATTLVRLTKQGDAQFPAE
ncbi:hypothetical protein, partial [Actinoplanes sp. GCM10030250]|uniref:hypothetical protein n=1 Tax=Actinoplanes sp. GCM10030250 TaxID=3273376 RepID=UPI00361D010F